MAKLNVIKNSINGTLIGIINKLISIIGPFLIRTIIIHKIGAEYAGLNTLFTSILQVISLSEMGLGTAIVFAMYQPVAEDNKVMLSALLNFYRKLYYAIGALIFLVGLAFLPFLKYLVTGTVPNDISLELLYIIFLINTAASYSILSYRGSLLNAYQREDINAGILSLTNIVMYIFQIIVLNSTGNYYGYAILLPVFTILYNFIRYVFVTRKFKDIRCEGDISSEQKRVIKTNVSALVLHKIGSMTVNTIDNIIISAFLGLTMLSMYGNYYYILSACTSIIVIFFNAVTAGIGNKLLTSSEDNNRQNFFCIFYINGFIVAIVTGCLFSLYQSFITLWLGEKYLFDFGTVILFCIYFYVHTVRRTIIMFRDAAGLWKLNKWQPIISSIVNVVLNIVLLQFIGIKGILLSTILSMILVDIPWETKTTFSCYFQESQKKYALKFMIYTIITFLICGVFCIFKINIDLGNGIVDFIVQAICSLGISIVIFILLTFTFPEFKFIQKKVYGYVGNRIRKQ